MVFIEFSGDEVHTGRLRPSLIAEVMMTRNQVTRNFTLRLSEPEEIAAA
eukprot:COSAG02_NODE_6462_length_3555_cov_18.813082_2_plen_48_part_01